MAGTKSVPVTRAPDAASRRLQRPTPHPTSSTLTPGATPSHPSQTAERGFPNTYALARRERSPASSRPTPCRRCVVSRSHRLIVVSVDAAPPPSEREPIQIPHRGGNDLCDAVKDVERKDRQNVAAVTAWSDQRHHRHDQKGVLQIHRREH